jgi:hypothetical protein
MDVYHIHVTYIREKKSVLYYINVADSLLLALRLGQLVVLVLFIFFFFWFLTAFVLFVLK